MLMAALLDLGVVEEGEERLRAVVAALGLPPAVLRVVEVKERGIRARRVDVAEEGGQPRRGPAEVLDLIGRAALPAGVKERAAGAVTRLAEVEAAVHGLPLEQVHFHELGAVDTMVDVVGVFTLWEALGSPRVVCAPLPLGSGVVEIAHGRLAIPAPATLALCREVPVTAGVEACELTTPTGALLATELAEQWGPIPAMQPQAIGYGAGHRRLESGPNLLRVVLGGETVRGAVGEREAPDSLVLLETDIDDMTGEELGRLQEALLAAGAVDVWMRPVQMKKNRPGVELALLVEESREDELTGVLFRESSTFGLRRRPVERHCLEREWLEIVLQGVTVAVKVGRWRGQVTAVSPEYESAAAAARALGRPLAQVMQEARSLARARLGGTPL